MRWDALFGDLESQGEAALAEERASEVADRTRLEFARIALVDRLRARVGERISLRVGHLGPVSGTLMTVGPDWLQLSVDPGGADLVVANRWLLAVTGLGAGAVSPETVGLVSERLDLRYALRRLVAERVPVQVTVAGGGSIAGTLDRVGSDHLDIAEHPVDQPRRPSAVRATHTLPLRTVVAVRSR
jgi:hypothetical protein